jgi:hypothetical protein
MPIVDRLLTENQKVEFHSQALRYLQQNTHRCVSCGGGNFNKLLGEQSANEVVKRKGYDSIINDVRQSSDNDSEDEAHNHDLESKFTFSI